MADAERDILAEVNDAVARFFGDMVICERCGATFGTYTFNGPCNAPRDEPCPGFLAVEHAIRQTQLAN